MKTNTVLCLILMAFLGVGCTSDMFITDWNATLEYNEEGKVSSFSLSNTNLKLPASLQQVIIYLTSQSDGRLYQFNAQVFVRGSYARFKMKMDSLATLSDSDYTLEIGNTEGTRYPRRFTVTVRDNMVKSVQSDAFSYAGYLEGEGTEDNPYQIHNLVELTDFFALLAVDSDHARDRFFVQKANITLEGQGTSGADRGHIGQPFAGHYNGNNHSIHNLWYLGTASDEDVNVGLFSVLYEGAEIRNLTLDNIDLKNTKEKVGALAGSSVGAVYICNVTVTGSITTSSDFMDSPANYVGGYIGMASSDSDEEAHITFMDSDFSVSIDAGDIVGGVLGCGDNIHLSLQNVSAASFKDIKGGSKVGGIVGWLMGSCDFGTVVLKHNSASDTRVHRGTGNYIGGVVGRFSLLSPSSMNTITVQMPVQGDEASSRYVGGIAGEISTDGETQELVLRNLRTLDNKVEGEKYVGGFFGYATKIDFLFTGTRTHTQSQTLKGQQYVGGLFGRLVESSITFEKDVLVATSINSQESTGSQIGGFAGAIENCGTMNLSLLDLDAISTIYGGEDVGGFAGFSFDTNYQGPHHFSFNKSTVFNPDELSIPFLKCIIGKDRYEVERNAGGFIGRCDRGSISDIVVATTVNGIENTGGLVGHSYNVSLYHCAWDGHLVNGVGPYVGGLVGLHECHANSGNGEYLLSSGDKVSGGGYVGGVFGAVMGTEYERSFTLCVNTAHVEGTGNGDQANNVHIGGIVGYLDDTQKGLIFCANYGTISSNGDGLGIGGILGFGHSKIRIDGCVNHGTVSMSDESNYSGLGGIAGMIGQKPNDFSAEDNDFTITCSCNRGTLDGKNGSASIGGIIGFMREGGTAKVYNCYNWGDTNNGFNCNRGGIVGLICSYDVCTHNINYGISNCALIAYTDRNRDRYISIYDNYYLEGTGYGYDGNYSFSAALGKQQSTFSKLDFVSAWQIDPTLNDGYPYINNDICYFQFATLP